MHKEILTKGATEYEHYRTAFINNDVQGTFPKEIHIVRSVDDVVEAVKQASKLQCQIGVRSGGHTFSNPSLVQNGILIDTSKLNRGVKYDSETEEIEFGPAVRVREAAEALGKVQRFFPFGHAPSVALGGFCLAGGQGICMRGWGATAPNWLTRMEIVMPNGSVVTASKSENQKLFWAARGSGQAFFGVVTRFWGRTIPARNLYEQSFLFKLDDKFTELLQWACEMNDAMPKDGTEAALSTFSPKKSTSDLVEGEVPDPSTLLLGISCCAYVHSLEEAKEKLGVWKVPEELRANLLQATPAEDSSWQKFFDMQDTFIPYGHGERWQINSMLNDPSVPLAQVLDAIKAPMCELPTHASVGCIYFSDTYPDEEECAFSLPQQYYISTFTGWKDPSLQPDIYKPMQERYSKIQNVSCGMYVADYNPFDETQANVNVMTSTAWAKWLNVKQEWDPANMFPLRIKNSQTHPAGSDRL